MPACAQETILQNGLSSANRLASTNLQITTAAAPSLIPDAFPAVTVPVPSLINAVRNLDKVSIDVLGVGNSSVVIVVVSELAMLNLYNTAQVFLRSFHKMFRMPLKGKFFTICYGSVFFKDSLK